MTDQNCCESVYRPGMFRPGRCSKKATKEHNGRPYCSLHYPPTVAAKRDERSARWKAKWAAENAAAKANNKRIKLGERALDYMRSEYPEMVQEWEQGMK